VDTNLGLSDSARGPAAVFGRVLARLAEPLYEFIAAARAFRRAFIGAAAVKNGKDMSEGDPGVRPGMSAPNALRPPVGSALLHLRGGGVEHKEISPSLLGSIVIMAKHDLASERRVIRCANPRCASLLWPLGIRPDIVPSSVAMSRERLPPRIAVPRAIEVEAPSIRCQGVAFQACALPQEHMQRAKA